MERHHNKGHHPINPKNHKANPTTSRHKKDPRLASKGSKHLKTATSKGNLATVDTRELGLTSPVHEPANDYGVNPYFPKHKAKINKKKEQVEMVADYGTFE